LFFIRRVLKLAVNYAVAVVFSYFLSSRLLRKGGALKLDFFYKIAKTVKPVSLVIF